jgi:hypothetical protein
MDIRLGVEAVEVVTIGMTIDRAQVLLHRPVLPMAMEMAIQTATPTILRGLEVEVEVHHHLTGEEDLHHPHHEEVHHQAHRAIILARKMILDDVVLLLLLELVVLLLGLLVVEVAVVVAVIRTQVVVPPVPPRRLIVAAVVTGVAADPGAAIVIAHAVHDAGAVVPRGAAPRGRRIPTRMTREVRLRMEAAAWRPRRVMVVPNQKQRPRKIFTPRINVPSLSTSWS